VAFGHRFGGEHQAGRGHKSVGHICTFLNNEIALSEQKGQLRRCTAALSSSRYCSAGISTFSYERLLRIRRAGPSASLEKSADMGFWLVAG
jgi:hypothetical protein